MDFWHWMSEGMGYVVIFLGLGTGFGAWLNHFREAKNAMQRPKLELRNRIDKIEMKLDDFAEKSEDEHKEYEARFKRDLERHNKNAKESKLILRSLLTIIKSSIDGNHIEELQERQEEIQTYLIDKA